MDRNLLLCVTLVSCAAWGCDGSASTDPSPRPGDDFGLEIAYGTFVGGSDFEEIREPVLLPGGALLFGARTLSSNMPVTGGAYKPGRGGGRGDSYLGILSADGSSLEAGTYFGGSGMERPPYGIAVAGNGDVVFTSGTTSPDLPTSASSVRPSLHQPVPEPGDGYVCRISGDLSTLRWCTYTGGGWPRAGLTLDDSDRPIVAGDALGGAFPTTPGVFQREARGPADGFVMKLLADGTELAFSTRLGGSGSGGDGLISVVDGPDGSLYVNGSTRSADFPVTDGAPQEALGGASDAYAAILSSGAEQLLHATFFGGGREEFAEHRQAVAPDGDIVSVGVAESRSLPVAGSAPGGTNGYVFRWSPGSEQFEFVRFLGGGGDDFFLGPVIDAGGNIYTFGNTSSRDLPVSEGAIQSSFAGGDRDGVLWVLDPAGELLYSTYIGGSGDELIRGIAIDASGSLYLVGRTTSDDFPVTSGAFQTSIGGGDDGFVLKLRVSGSP